jgi:hypothetical protein
MALFVYSAVLLIVGGMSITLRVLRCPPLARREKRHARLHGEPALQKVRLILGLVMIGAALLLAVLNTLMLIYP